MPSVLDAIGNTPLVPLGRVAAHLSVPVLAKCEHLNPGGSVKDRIALAIVRDAEARGALRPGDTIVEATAGNTGLGLALVAGACGYRLVCVMPEKMSLDKRTSLTALGARVEITPNVPLGHPANFQSVARRLAADHPIGAHTRVDGLDVVEVGAGDVDRRQLTCPHAGRDLRGGQADDLSSSDSSASVHAWTVTVAGDTFRSES